MRWGAAARTCAHRLAHRDADAYDCKPANKLLVKLVGREVLWRVVTRRHVCLHSRLLLGREWCRVNMARPFFWWTNSIDASPPREAALGETHPRLNPGCAGRPGQGLSPGDPAARAGAAMPARLAVVCAWRSDHACVIIVLPRLAKLGNAPAAWALHACRPSWRVKACQHQ